MGSYVGLDVGTSAVKGALVTATGSVAARARRPLRLHRPRPGFVEIAPEEHYRAVCEVLGELASEGREGIRAICMAAASHSTFAMQVHWRCLSLAFTIVALHDAMPQPISTVSAMIQGQRVRRRPGLALLWGSPTKRAPSLRQDRFQLRCLLRPLDVTVGIPQVDAAVVAEGRTAGDRIGLPDHHSLGTDIFLGQLLP